MLFFFDESGDFCLPKQMKHKIAIVMGIVIPETCKASFKKVYLDFIRLLKPSEKDRGEPKGNLLSVKNREIFCDLLNLFPDIKIIPATLDLTMLDPNKTQQICINMKEKLYGESKKCIHETMCQDVQLLGRQFGNLSLNQALHLSTMAYCFRETIQHTIIFFASHKFRECFNQMSFIVDAHNIKERREEKVFRIMLLSWLTAWSRKEPLELIKEFHTSDHPLVRNFDTEKGMDIGKMIKPNLFFKPSKTEWGLQVADIACNTLYNALNDLNGHKNMLRFYPKIMKNCHYGKRRGPGLVAFFGENQKEEIEKPAGEKYRMLSKLGD